jgi:cytochrome P450
VPVEVHQQFLRLDQLAGTIQEATRAMLERWEAKENPSAVIDVDREMMRLTLEIVGKALFSIDLRSQASELTSAVVVALDHIVGRVRNPFSPPGFIPTRSNRLFRSALQSLNRAVYKMIQDRRAAGDPGNDLLGMLLQARDEETGKQMDDRQIRDEIITIIIAGHETVASALSWTWYLLASHPQVRDQIDMELASVLGNNEPVSNDIQRLDLTRAVIDEALRLYPPAWLITRKAVGDDNLGDYRIQAGALMIISPFLLHRSPEYWKNPQVFNPARFLGVAGAERPRYAYIPFGGGPRMCIGNSFALLEARLILAMVAQRYRLRLAPGAAVLPEALVTLRPQHGLAMLLDPGPTHA